MPKFYELHPDGNQKSFGGKALVFIEYDDEGNVIETLYSYEVPIIRRNADKTLTRLWDDWSQTTGKHIKAFCGYDKARFCAMEVEK